MIVRELVTKLGFDADESKVKSFDKVVGTLAKTLAGIVVGAGAVAAGLFKATQAVAEQGDKIAKSARDASIASDAYQEYAYVLGQGGVSTGEFDVSLKRLSKTVGDARTGTKMAQDTFKELGISLKDSSGKAKTQAQILDDVTAALAKETDEAKRASFATELFGRGGQRMAVVLASGTEAIDKQREAFRAMGGVISEEALKDSEKFNDEMDNMSRVVSGLKVSILSGLLPVITDIVVELREWVMENRELIKVKAKEFIEKLTTVLKAVWAATVIVVGVFGELITQASDLAENFGGLENVAKTLAAAFIAIKAIALAQWLYLATGAVWKFTAALLANPLTWIVVAVVALTAAIAYVIYQFVEWARTSATLRLAITKAFDGIKDFFNDTIDSMVAKWEAFKKFISNPVKGAIDFFTSDGGIAANAQTVASQASSGMGRGAINMRVNNDVKVTVPSGTTQEQALAINSQVERQMRSVLAREISGASLALEGM